MNSAHHPAHHSALRKGILRHIGVYRFSVIEFLVALVLMLVVTPFIHLMKNGDSVESVLMTVVLVFGVLAVGKSRRVMWLAILLVSPAILGKWLNHLQSNWVSPVWFLISGLVFVTFLIFQLFHFILRSSRVNAEVMCAGLSSYLLLGLAWAFAYALVAEFVPNAFMFNVGPDSIPEMKHFTCLYFSYITLCTVGYGDITPVKDVARMLAAMEAMTGTLFVAVLISRLVSMYSSQPQPPPVRESQKGN